MISQVEQQFAGFRKTYNRRVGHWPLCCPPDTIVQRALISIITTIGIGQKEGIDITPL
jgi:hypothetical protein